MTIAWQQTGAADTGTTSLSLAYPVTGLAAGDIFLLCIACKKAVYPSTPSGWTLITGAQGTNAGNGDGSVDQGYGRVSVYYKIAVGTESGSQAVTITSGNSCAGLIIRYRATRPVLFAASVGADDTTGSNTWSITGAQALDVKVGDVVVAVSAINTDAYTYNTQAPSIGAATFAAVVERAEAASSRGDDCHLNISEHTVTGAGSAASPTFSMTSSGNGTNAPEGTTALFRMQEASGRVQAQILG
jgi:hypothetical protein